MSQKSSSTLYYDKYFDINIHPFTLSFSNKALETNFIKKLRASNLLKVRMGSLLIIVLFASYGLLDKATYPSFYLQMWSIRLLLVATLLFIFFLTFRRKCVQHVERISIVILFVSGATLCYFYTFPLETKYAYTFFSSYTLLLIGSFVLLGLRFITIVKSVLILHASATYIFYIQMDQVLFYSYGILFISILALVGFGSYFSELYQRKLFLNDQYLNHLNSDLKRAKKTLTDQVNRDPLTNLYNRRYFHTISDDYYQLAKRENRDLCVLLIDIDRFKSINDNYGHLTGDAVILACAKTLLSNIRSSDILARFGGEEFVILMPSTDIEGACHIAEKLRLAVEKSTVLSEEKKEVHFTISLGIDQVNIHQKNGLEQAFNHADKALYAAKAAGRNSIKTFEHNN